MREAWPNNILKASLTFKVGLKFYWQVNKRSDNWDLSLNNISNSSCGHNTTAPHQCVLCGCCCGDSCVVAALFNSNHNSQCKYQTVRGQNTRNDLIIDNHWLMQDLRTHLNIFSLNFTLMGHWTQHCQSSEDWFIDSSQNIESASGLVYLGVILRNSELFELQLRHMLIKSILGVHDITPKRCKNSMKWTKSNSRIV